MNFSHSSPTILTFDSQIWTQSDRSHTSWMSLQRNGDRGHEIKLRKLAQQAQSPLPWVPGSGEGTGILPCPAPGMVWQPRGSMWRFSKASGSSWEHPVDQPRLSQRPPTCLALLAESSFCPSVPSSIAITLTAAGTHGGCLAAARHRCWALWCTFSRSAAASERFSGCLGVFVPACGRGVCRGASGVWSLGGLTLLSWQEG